MSEEQPSLYYEKKIAERLGLPRESLSYLRENVLKKDAGHWLLHGRDIVLTADGVLALATHLDLKELPAIDDCLVAEKNSPDNGTVELTVVRSYPNRRLLQATAPGDPPQLVNVQVTDNANFRPKMKLRAYPPSDGQMAYRLAGRCPRYPGKW